LEYPARFPDDRFDTVPRESGRKFALLCVATLTILAPTVIAPALPRVVEAFRGVPHVDLLAKLMLTLPALFIAVGAPLAGAIVDRFGRMGLLRGCLALYGFAGAAGYVLDDLYAILASRALLGVAIAGSMTTLTALVGDYFHGEERARFASLQSMSMSLGAMVFVGVGGLLADVSWRLVFLVYLAGWRTSSCSPSSCSRCPRCSSPWGRRSRARSSIASGAWAC